MKKIKPSPTSQKGAVAVLVAITLPVLLGVGALAVDLAYLHVVRNELQNDADAAALAGARKLYKQGASVLNWSAAEAAATNAIGLNRAAGHALSQGLVETGYWDTSQTAKGLQALPMKPGATDAPAVQVNLGKTDTQNQGPVRTFFASIWGVYAKPVRVTAVAGVHSPSSAALSFPIAISLCMYQTYWNLGAQPPGPLIDTTTQKPHVFNIVTKNDTDECAKGQWTVLNFDVTGTDKIVQIIDHDVRLFENPPPMLSIGDSIPLGTGIVARLYDSVKACIGARLYPCDLVVLPVVDRVVPGETVTIRSFACMRLLDAGKDKNNPYIKVQMSNECPSLPSGGIGPNYGVISPPSLFK
jgi:Flp pilus assembly protein TadG